jgi:hypothetical protein
MLPYLTVTGGPTRFMRMTRLILLAFPVFIAMAKLCKNRLWLVPFVSVWPLLRCKNRPVYAATG